MIPVFISFVAFACSWLIHLVIWRVQFPNSQLKALLIIFLSTWVTAVVLSVFSVWANTGFIHFLYFSLIYWSAALCYVITYSAMEGDSPTLSLARYLHRMGDKGVLYEEIEEFFRQRPFIGARIRALVTDRILIEESGGYRLRSGKYLFFHTILLYRRVVFGPVSSGG